MIIDEGQFKKFVLDSGLVTKEDFESAVKKAIEKKQKIGDVLLSDGKLSETDLKRMEAFVLGIPFISLAKEFCQQKALKISSYYRFNG